MAVTKQRKLETYIAQGKAYKELLAKTNSHGKHSSKINSISRKLAKAKRTLNQL